MEHLNSFYADKPEGKFVALFSDGSGARLYYRLDDEDGLPVYCDSEGDLVTEPETYFIDAGYSNWMPLPDSFRLWFEQVPQ